MRVTITEVNNVEGAWVESATATYSVAYEQEVQELAVTFGFDSSWGQEPLTFLANRVGESAEAPAFLVEAEDNPNL